MRKKPLEGRQKCTKCSEEYDWFYHGVVRIHDNIEEPLKTRFYNGRDGSVYNDIGIRYIPREKNLTMNVGEPREVISNYQEKGLWGINVPLRCPYCKMQIDTVFIDLRE